MKILAGSVVFSVMVLGVPAVAEESEALPEMNEVTKSMEKFVEAGELGGRRYLKPESVRRMTSVQSGDLETGFTPGNAWGLGWCVVREPQGVSGALSPGSFGHGGAFGTQVWRDPVKKRVDLLMVQRSNFPNSDASDVRKALHEGAAKP
jgi:CubicO group peptidase (beta-lactamase class C family)